MRAAVLLRPMDHYKREIFGSGLARHGFVISDRWSLDPNPDDAILLWNRARAFEPIAELYEKRGARVLIAENGYTAPTSGGKHYALALDRHNGAGRWWVGDRPRHEIPAEPWRESGDHVLVLPQRGIGSPGVAMPSSWQRNVLERIGAATGRPVVLRPHPGHGRNKAARSLAEDLVGAHCAVTWGSGAGIKAIQAGVPVFHEFERWIGSAGARRLDGQVECCNTPDRELLWTRISWAQWELGEIASGEAFDGLINASRGDLFRAGQQPLDDHRQRDVRGGAAAWTPGGTQAVEQPQGCA